jgi:hypothetical protein
LAENVWWSRLLAIRLADAPDFPDRVLISLRPIPLTEFFVQSPGFVNNLGLIIRYHNLLLMALQFAV